jgi:hypothetical protein
MYAVFDTFVSFAKCDAVDAEGALFNYDCC